MLAWSTSRSVKSRDWRAGLQSAAVWQRIPVTIGRSSVLSGPSRSSEGGTSLLKEPRFRPREALFMRTATIKRKTKETDIEVTVNLDGKGVCNAGPGIGFLYHMHLLRA